MIIGDGDHLQWDVNYMNKEETLHLIDTHLNTIKNLTKECVRLADEAGVSFSFPEPCYGTGCDYSSKQAYIKEYGITDPKEIKEIMEDSDDHNYEYGKWGWSASSNSGC